MYTRTYECTTNVIVSSLSAGRPINAWPDIFLHKPVVWVRVSVSFVGHRNLVFGCSRDGDEYEPVVQEIVGNRDDKYPNPQGSMVLVFRNICLALTIGVIAQAFNGNPWCCWEAVTDTIQWFVWLYAIWIISDDFIFLMVISKWREQYFGWKNISKKFWIKVVDVGSQFEENVQVLGVNCFSCLVSLEGEIVPMYDVNQVLVNMVLIEADVYFRWQLYPPPITNFWYLLSTTLWWSNISFARPHNFKYG